MHRTYCHGKIYWNKVFFHRDDVEPMVWIKKVYTYWRNMHSLTINHNFCDTWKCSRNHTPLQCISYVDLGGRMLDNFTVCQIWKWPKIYFSLGHENSQHCSPLKLHVVSESLGKPVACDLSLCVIERAGNLPCLCWPLGRPCFRETAYMLWCKIQQLKA